MMVLVLQTGGLLVLNGGHTVGGRNSATPKTPCKDDSRVNTNKQRFPMVSKWCRNSSIHSVLVVTLGTQTSA